MAKNRADGSYMGLDFYINDYWLFFVPDLDHNFKSYGEMTTAIDNEEKRVKATKRVKLSLPVLDENGHAAVITGVHSGHGRVITSPKIETSGWRHELSPDTPWMRELFARIAANQSESELLDKIRERFSFEAKGTPESIEKAYNAKLKAANATTLQQQLAK